METPPENRTRLQSISSLNFLILSLMVSLRSDVQSIGAAGTVENDYRSTSRVSVGNLTDAEVAFVTEDRRQALRKYSFEFNTSWKW